MPLRQLRLFRLARLRGSLRGAGKFSFRHFAVFRFLAAKLPVVGVERPRRAGLACPAPCHSGPNKHRPSLLYLRGTRQPDTALPHPRGLPAFQAKAGGNGGGDQGRWVTGAVKYRGKCRPTGRHGGLSPDSKCPEDTLCLAKARASGPGMNGGGCPTALVALAPHAARRKSKVERRTSNVERRTTASPPGESQLRAASRPTTPASNSVAERAAASCAMMVNRHTSAST